MKYQNTIQSKNSKDKVKSPHGQMIPRAELNMDDFTATIRYKNGSSELFFLTKVYKSGHLLGFYSHSPWGGVRDKEQGWVIINSNTLQIEDQIETRTDGRSTGEYAKWYKNVGETYGKSMYLLNKFGNREWKITEVDK